MQIGDTLYTAEFPKSDLKSDKLKDGEHVQAEVKNGKLTIRFDNGNRVVARVRWIQKTIVPTHS